MQPLVYVTFTTTPDRIDLIKPMLDSLMRQTLQDFEIYLWVCHYYPRVNLKFDKKDIPEFLQNSPVKVRFCEDYGSNTKLHPMLQMVKDPQAMIITVDDDTIYPDTCIETLVSHSLKEPNAAFGFRGKILKKTRRIPFLGEIKKKKFIYAGNQTIRIHEDLPPQRVDFLTGVWSIIYRRYFFDDNYFDLEQCPEARYCDDIWSQGHVAKRGHPRKCIQKPVGFADVEMESKGVKRLWDSINNFSTNNDKVIQFFQDVWCE